MHNLNPDADEDEIAERNKKFVSVLAEFRREVKFMRYVLSFFFFAHVFLVVSCILIW